MSSRRYFDLQEAQNDLANFDLLLPRLTPLHRLVEKANSSEMALGSDVMSAALEGYALVKVAGKGQGLEAMSVQLVNTGSWPKKPFDLIRQKVRR